MKTNGNAIDRTMIISLISTGYLQILKKCGSSLIENGISLFMIAATIYSQSDIMRYLVEKGASVNVVDEEGFTPLMRISFIGRLDDVKVLISHGANINYRSKKAITSLSCACLSGKLEIVQFLLKMVLIFVPILNQPNIYLYSLHPLLTVQKSLIILLIKRMQIKMPKRIKD